MCMFCFLCIIRPTKEVTRTNWSFFFHLTSVEVKQIDVGLRMKMRNESDMWLRNEKKGLPVVRNCIPNTTLVTSEIFHRAVLVCE